MIVTVKYGFESMPVKTYNTNVSSAVLLSFLKATCIKDIDEYCKQRNIQLSIELDAIRRAMMHRKSVSASTANVLASAPPSRPPSGNGSATAASEAPSTPSTTRRGSNASAAVAVAPDDQAINEDESMKEKKAVLESQLERVNNAAKTVKELIAGVAWVDLVDQNGTRMNLDTAGATRVNTILTARQQYSAIAVSTTETGEPKVSPLVFKLTP